MSAIATTHLKPLGTLLLITASLMAHGQDRQPTAAEPLPVIERHHNPDYVAPDTKQHDRQSTAKRPRISGIYAIPFGPDQVFALTRYNANDVQFNVSHDGKRLIVSHRTEDDDDDPAIRRAPFGPGLFSRTRPRHSLSMIR